MRGVGVSFHVWPHLHAVVRMVLVATEALQGGRRTQLRVLLLPS